jgi:hypothetical protein
VIFRSGLGWKQCVERLGPPEHVSIIPRIMQITFFLFIDTDTRLGPNQVDTVIDNDHIDHRTKRFGLNWSIYDSFLLFCGFDPSGYGVLTHF